MTAVREHILELMSLQYYVDRQLFTNRVEIVLEVLLTCRINLSAFLYRFIIHILDPSSKTYFVTDVSSLDFNDFLFFSLFFIVIQMSIEVKRAHVNLEKCDHYKFLMLCKIKFFRENSTFHNVSIHYDD